MNISLEDYNKVIIGLRTQLSLQSKYLNEKDSQIETLRELNKLKDEEIIKLKVQRDALLP